MQRELPGSCRTAACVLQYMIRSEMSAILNRQDMLPNRFRSLSQYLAEDAGSIRILLYSIILRSVLRLLAAVLTEAAVCLADQEWAEEAVARAVLAAAVAAWAAVTEVQAAEAAAAEDVRNKHNSIMMQCLYIQTLHFVWEGLAINAFI